MAPMGVWEFKIHHNLIWFSGFRGQTYREITKIRVLLGNGADKKERTKRNESIGMQRGANFTIVFTTLLIVLNIKFCETFAKQHVY